MLRWDWRIRFTSACELWSHQVGADKASLVGSLARTCNKKMQHLETHLSLQHMRDTHTKRRVASLVRPRLLGPFHSY